MTKKYDKPAIIDSKKIDPQGDGCQQGNEESAPVSAAAGRRTGRGHLRIVKKQAGPGGGGRQA